MRDRADAQREGVVKQVVLLKIEPPTGITACLGNASAWDQLGTGTLEHLRVPSETMPGL
jgi:hypothetical protein